jgi:uncharacterized protein YrrD
MEFKKDTSVFTANGEDVGRIDRVVLDPHTKEVTHVVVRKGFFFTEDKVVPISLIAGATEDKVTLREDAGDLQSLPDFEETHYVVVNEEELARSARSGRYAPPLYWYPPVTPMAGYPGFYEYPGYSEPAYIAQTEQNIPEDTVALKEGAKVIAADGEHAGNIEELLTNAGADRVTHIVISQGLIFKEKKLVPSAWIGTVDENEVHLTVGSGTLDKLRSYEN